MISTWTLAAIVFAALSLLARLAILRIRHRSVRLAADLALVLSAACALVSCASPDQWTRAIVSAPPVSSPQPEDPRLPGALAVAIASMAALPGLLGTTRLSKVTVIAPGAMLATVAIAAIALLGLHDGYPLSIVGLGAFALGTVITTALRADRSSRVRAAVAGGAAIVAASVAVALLGARSDEVDLRPGATGAALGYTLALREAKEIAPRGHALVIEVQRASRLREVTPRIGRRVDGRPDLRSAGDWYSGPVVAPVSFRLSRGAAHPTLWLARGDSVRIGDALVRFQRFRMVNGDTIRVLADLSVTRGGETRTLSPGMYATREGSRPFAVDLPGVGPVAVARMDADGGRVALVVPQGPNPPGEPMATVRMQLRPGLPVGWAGMGLVLIAMIAALAMPPRAAEGAGQRR